MKRDGVVVVRVVPRLREGNEQMSRVLVVVSAADKLVLADGSSHPTGFWAEEVVESVRVLRDAGVRVDIATPGGVRPTVDAVSLTEEFGAYLASIDDELAAPLRLADVDV